MSEIKTRWDAFDNVKSIPSRLLLMDKDDDFVKSPDTALRRILRDITACDLYTAFQRICAP